MYRSAGKEADFMGKLQSVECYSINFVMPSHHFRNVVERMIKRETLRNLDPFTSLVCSSVYKLIGEIAKKESYENNLFSHSCIKEVTNT